jgi:hypothetical protein
MEAAWGLDRWVITTAQPYLLSLAVRADPAPSRARTATRTTSVIKQPNRAGSLLLPCCVLVSITGTAALAVKSKSIVESFKFPFFFVAAAARVLACVAILVQLGEPTLRIDLIRRACSAWTMPAGRSGTQASVALRASRCGQLRDNNKKPKYMRTALVRSDLLVIFIPVYTKSYCYLCFKLQDEESSVPPLPQNTRVSARQTLMHGVRTN